MKKSYATKKDGWLVALLWAAVLVMLGAAWNLWNAPLPLGVAPELIHQAARLRGNGVTLSGTTTSVL